MKMTITEEQFRDLYFKSQSMMLSKSKPEFDDPRYLLAFEFFKVLEDPNATSSAKVRVLELIRKDVELIDDE